MLLSTACLFVLFCFMLFEGSSTAGTWRESKVLNKWKRHNDAWEEARPIVKKERDEKFADILVRIERTAPPKRKGLIRRKSKKQMKRQRPKKEKINRIHPLLKVNTPLDHNTLIDLLNDGVRQSKHFALSTQTKSQALDNVERQPYMNKTSNTQRKYIDSDLSTKINQTDNRYPAAVTNLQSAIQDPSEYLQEATTALDVGTITLAQTTILEHDNRYSTSRTYLQSTPPDPSEISQETTQTSENASHTRVQATTHAHDYRYSTSGVGLHSTPLVSSETPQEVTQIRDITPVAWNQTITPNQKHDTPHIENVVRDFNSNLAAVRLRIHNHVLNPIVQTPLGSSDLLTRQRDSYFRSAASRKCNNTRDMNSCMSSFSAGGMSSLRNAQTVIPRKRQGGKADKLKSRQVIMLANMFNKSLSQTWKLLIPHPKLVPILQNQSRSEGIIDTQHDAESPRSLPASPQLIVTKLKKKKAKVYTSSDHRPSAIGIGSVGALVLVAIVVGIIILDSRSLCRDMRRLKRGIYNLCKPVYKHRLTISTSSKKGEKWAYAIHERHV